MDVWADQVARGIGGAGVWNVSTWGRDGGMGWALCSECETSVVLALNESTAR